MVSDGYDVAVLGAGASGLFCAAGSAARGLRTIVLDHAEECGRKVRVSGGGRCNFTNLGAAAADYVCGNRHFPKSALARWTPAHAVQWLRDRGLPVFEEEGGKIFSRRAGDVADALEADAVRAGAELRAPAIIHGACRDGGGFRADTDCGPIRARSLVLALGGLSWPQIGATNLGRTLAKSFGLRVTTLRPGLVPLLAGDDLADLCSELSGTSLPVRMGKPCDAEGSLLFTHRGISGPAVLDASLSWREGITLRIDLAPGADLAGELARTPRQSVKNVLARILPNRLAEALSRRYGWTGNAAELSSKRISAMESQLHGFEFAPKSDAGWAKAEVTVGGVDTDGLSSKTMESKAVPGLYVIGELQDVTGRLGGFNLQWAWSSGFAAGESV